MTTSSPVSLAASLIALHPSSVVVSGFSTMTLAPARVDRDTRSACGWAGAATTTASTVSSATVRSRPARPQCRAGDRPRADNRVDLLRGDDSLEVRWPVVAHRRLPRCDQEPIVVLHPARIRVAPGDELRDLSVLLHAGLDKHLGPVAGSYDGVASPRV